MDLEADKNGNSLFPSFSSVPTFDTREKSRDEEKRKRSKEPDDRRRRHRSKSREKIREKKMKRSKSRSTSPKRKSREDGKGGRSKRPETMLPKDAYIQTRPDNQNLLIGYTHKSDAPSFYRFGQQKVVGMPSHLSVSLSKPGKTVRKPQLQKIRLEELRSVARSAPVKYLPLEDASNHLLDFIPLDVIDVEEEVQNEDEAFTAKTEELNKLLAIDATQAETWMELVKLQETLLTQKKASLGGVIEKQISILERALSILPHDEGLLLEYLKAGAQLWDSPRILTRWDEILEENPDSIALWLAHLDFRLSDARSFSFTSMCDLFVEIIGIVNHLANDNIKTRVFVKYCTFLHQCGYLERAMATFRAQYEMVWIKGDFEKKKLELETMWDRLWWPKSETTEESVAAVRRWWWLTEVGLNSCRIPKHPDDMTDDSDPFSFVLFEDVGPTLVDLNDSSGLIYSFLRFLGLPINPMVGSEETCQILNQEGLPLPMDVDWCGKEIKGTSSHTFPMNALQVLELCVRDTHDFTHNTPMIKHVLDGLSEMIPRFAGFLLEEEPDNYVKGLLRNKKDDAMLWLAYAYMQDLLGDEKADKVYITTLANPKQFPGQDLLPVARRFAEKLLWDGKTNEALNVVYSVLEEIPLNVAKMSEPLSSPVMLKLKKTLNKKLASPDYTFNSYGISLHLETIVCMAIVEHVVRDVDAANACFLQHHVGKSNLWQEFLVMEHATFLHKHNKSGMAFKPGLLRGVLDPSLKQFPYNTKLLQMYLENETMSRIENRFRLLMAGTLKKHMIPVDIFALHAEFNPTPGVPRNDNVIRSLFQTQSLQNQDLWIGQLLYLTEVLKDVQAAKALYWQALQTCPWSKSLHLFAFSNLSVLTQEELDEVLQLLNEKELRLRVHE